MKTPALVLCLAAVAAANAQTTVKKPATTAKPATAASRTGTATHTASSSAIKLPPGVPPVQGVVKTAFSLRYEDIKIGTGAEAEPQKLYKVKYTGWRAADGVKFDSWDEHRQPVMDADGKPEMDADGKPKMGEPQPATFPVGIGRMIPGFDQGFTGMRVGGKRRLFIPWQLAYGTRAMPDHGPDHPGIPAKSDLIFDVELVDMTDLQMGPPPGSAPGAMGRPQMVPRPGGPNGQPTPPPASGAAAAGQPAAPPPADKPATPPPADKPQN